MLNKAFTPANHQPASRQSSQQPATAEPAAGSFQSTDDYCKIYYPDYIHREKTLLATQNLLRNIVYHYIRTDEQERYDESKGQFYIGNLIHQVSGYLTSDNPNLEQNSFLRYAPTNLWKPLTYKYDRLLSMSDNTENDVILSDTMPITQKRLQELCNGDKCNSCRGTHLRKLVIAQKSCQISIWTCCIGGRFDSNRFKTLNGVNKDTVISKNPDDIMASIENNLTVGSGGCVKITIDRLSDTVKQQYPGYLLCVVCCTDNQVERGIERYSISNM